MMNQRVYGFSLIEVIIGSAISLFLLAGLVAIYLSIQQTFRLQQALAELQENGH